MVAEPDQSEHVPEALDDGTRSRTGRDRPRFLDVGEAALVVEFGTAVHPAINDRVLALDAALGADPLPGRAETVPT